ncbi:MAG TPA: hypothetical protein VKZ44_08330, partial [Taishania sp.]|nr:hypothetical protein [Taishania sp.]
MLKKVLILILIWINGFIVSAQINVYQDIFRGGVTGDAFNPWNLPFGGNFEVYIEPGSTIRKAYLFVTVYFEPDEQILYFNGTPIILNQQNAINDTYSFVYLSDVRKMRTLMI